MIDDQYLNRVKELQGEHTVVALAASAFVREGYVYVVTGQTLGIGFGDKKKVIAYSLHGIEKPDIVDDTLAVIRYTGSDNSIAFVGDLDAIRELAEEAAHHHS